jgi:hypothetical protein
MYNRINSLALNVGFTTFHCWPLSLMLLLSSYYSILMPLIGLDLALIS